jgi:hypothetical protein
MMPQTDQHSPPREVPGIIADFQEMAKVQHLVQKGIRRLQSDNLTSFKQYLEILEYLTEEAKKEK